MTSKQQLKKRWLTEQGLATCNSLMVAIANHANQSELFLIIESLPYSEEVKPALDLRYLKFQDLLSLKNLNLSSARLDGAILNGNVVNCNMTNATLDNIKAPNLLLQSDFTSASFQQANLKGSRFNKSTLNMANFTKANLQGASLKDTICHDTIFHETNLKFSLCANADFRATDLAKANLTEASLGKILFDGKTCVFKTIFTNTTMHSSFREFAKKNGGIFDTNTDSYELVEFDTTLSALEKQNSDGHLNLVIKYMKTLRFHLVENSKFDWGTDLSNKFSEKILQEVANALQENM